MTKRIDEVIRHREALAAEWRSNHADRARIEIELDRTTTLLGELTGLGLPLLDPRAGLFGDLRPRAGGLTPLGSFASGRRRRISK
jgi:hypothetical protein